MTAASFAQSPVERDVEAIVSGVESIVAADDQDLTLGSLLEVLGRQSHTLVILVFCVLNMIPGPPGYGGTIAAAILSFGLAMSRNRPIGLPHVLGKRRISARIVLPMLGRLGWLARRLARLTAPRLTRLTGQAANGPIGIFIMVLCLPMMVPIPFMNAVPNVGLTVLCLARLNRDGVGVIVGAVLAVVGVGIDVAIVWGVFRLASMAGAQLW